MVKLSAGRRLLFAIARVLFVSAALLFGGTACSTLAKTVANNVDTIAGAAKPLAQEAAAGAGHVVDEAIEVGVPVIDNIAGAAVPVADFVIQEATKMEFDRYVAAQVADLRGRIEDVLGRVLTSEEVTILKDIAGEVVCETLDDSKEWVKAEINAALPASLAEVEGVDEEVLDIANAGSNQLLALAAVERVDAVAIAIEIGCELVN